MNQSGVGSNVAPAAKPEFDLVDVISLGWGLLWRRKWLIALGFLLGVGGGFYRFMTTPEQFESTANILVREKNAGLAARGAEATNGGEDLRMFEDILATHSAILTSHRVASEALKQAAIDLKRPADEKMLPSIAEAKKPTDDAEDYLISNLRVVKGGEGGAKAAHILRVSFRHRNPEETQVILNAVIGTYRKFLDDEYQDVSKQAVKLITDLSKRLGEELKVEEDAYLEFRKQAPLLWKGENSSSSSNVHNDRLAEIEQALSGIRVRHAEVKARLEVVEAALNETGERTATDLERLALLNERDVQRLSVLLELETGNANSEAFVSTQPIRAELAKADHEQRLALLLREKSLLAQYGPDHPKVREAQRNIDVINEFLKGKSTETPIATKRTSDITALVTAYGNLLRHDLDDLDKRQQQLKEAYDVEWKAAKELVGYQLEAEAKHIEVTRKKDLYDTARKDLEDLDLIRQYGGFLTEVIEQPRLGEIVSWKIKFSLAVGGLVGLIMGTGGAFLFDLTTRTFRNPGNIEHALGAPVMAHLPEVSRKAQRQAASLAASSGSHLAPIVQAFHRPKSPEAEAVRVLRNGLIFNVLERGQKSILITSAVADEGKSALAANLAVALAQSGRRVLLIDANLHGGALQHMLGAGEAAGLSTMLAGEAEFGAVFAPTEVEDLWLAPSGPVPPNPAELLIQPRFGQFLHAISEQFDCVLIDSPPTLAVADACAIAPRADAVLLALRVSRNCHPRAIQAAEALRGVGATIAGIAVTRYEAGNGLGYQAGVTSGTLKL